jgi:predicted flap endonuclease-1-like 5' DNA nuclease
MPEMNIAHFVLLASSTLIALIVGWFVRGLRSREERRAINASWKEQLREERDELERLSEQNKYLMEQNSAAQVSGREAMKRTRELSKSMQEAYQRRNDMRRKLKAIRGNLEIALNERNELKTNLAAGSNTADASKDKDDKIFQLSRELDDWQKRLPPLMARYRALDAEATELKVKLSEANARILKLEAAGDSDISRVEPVLDPEVLTDGHDASNDTIDTEQPSVSVAEATDEHGKTLRDDLQQIRGVGPAIEKTLNELGIFRYQQIANMSEYDIDRIARRLKGFHSRIYREDWIGQARELDTRNVSA